MREAIVHPDADLFELARERGYVLVPIEGWRGVVTVLAAEVADLRRALAAAEEKNAKGIDCTATVMQLSYMAGKVLPDTVAQLCDVSAENRELRARVTAAEVEAWRLAAIVINEEFPDHVNPDEELE